ncbi:TolC family protein [Eikenella sp. S3360]|uniref:TolC family protein n=1 Tax=Eikenella glucosivorans TaxID=2766967 RepID=A0ABS0N725_9NEIS|nr:TolC family protein [Eikenella glucosivorans]MBH5328113.1 TolC family protein [Eikenella glucosivorans]
MKPTTQSIPPVRTAVLALLLLGGCAIDRTPNSQIGLAQAQSEGTVNQAAAVADTAGQCVRAEGCAYQADSDWWQAFGDARLNALVQQALANNVDLKQAAVSVNKALYQANILGANLVPSYNASLGANASRNLDTRANSHSYSSQLGLSYELDLWRRLNATASAQVWEQRATEQDLAATRLTIINNVADAYFQVAYLNEAIKLSEQSQQQYRQILQIARSKYRHGRAASIEVTQAEQSLLSAQNSLLSLQQNRENTEATLRNLLNLRPGQQMAVQPADFSLPEGGQVDLNVPVSTLAARPDLLAADYRLQSALKSQQAQYRSWYPSITLNAALSSSSEHSRNLFNVPILGGSVSLNLPFLNWHTLRWRDRNAEADFENAKLAFEKALTTALNEVQTNYSQYQSSRQSLENLRRRYRLDVENSRYYRVRYQHGRNELKDWLSALNSEYGSAQSLLETRYQTLRYEAMVYKAMAGRYRRTDPAAQ